MGCGALQPVTIDPKTRRVAFELRDAVEQDGGCALDGHIDKMAAPFLAPSAFRNDRRWSIVIAAHPASIASCAAEMKPLGGKVSSSACAPRIPVSREAPAHPTGSRSSP